MMQLEAGCSLLRNLLLAHLHAHQARDENRQIELSSDGCGDRGVARMQGQGENIAKTRGERQGGRAPSVEKAV